MDIDLGAWKLRDWTDDDITALVIYANNVKIWMNVRDLFPHPYTESDAKQWIKLAGTTPVTNFAIASQRKRHCYDGSGCHRPIRLHHLRPDKTLCRCI